MDPKKIMAQLSTLSLHRKFCCDIVLIFVSQLWSWHAVSVATYFMLSSRILSRYNLAMSRHSFAEVVLSLSRHECLVL